MGRPTVNEKICYVCGKIKQPGDTGWWKYPYQACPNCLKTRLKEVLAHRNKYTKNEN